MNKKVLEELDVEWKGGMVVMVENGCSGENACDVRSLRPFPYITRDWEFSTYSIVKSNAALIDLYLSNSPGLYISTYLLPMNLPCRPCHCHAPYTVRFRHRIQLP